MTSIFVDLNGNYSPLGICKTAANDGYLFVDSSSNAIYKITPGPTNLIDGTPFLTMSNIYQDVSRNIIGFNFRLYDICPNVTNTGYLIIINSTTPLYTSFGNTAVFNVDLNGNLTSVLPFIQTHGQYVFGGVCVSYGSTGYTFTSLKPQYQIIISDLNGNLSLFFNNSPMTSFGNQLALNGPYGICLSYDGKYYIITNYNTNQIIIVTTYNGVGKQGIIANIGNGFLSGPAGLCISMDGTNYLVSNNINATIVECPIIFPSILDGLLLAEHTPVYTVENINNGILYNYNSMPFKEPNSDGSSTFASGRRSYIEQSKTVNTVSLQDYMHKKWIGGNRDGSSVIDRRRNYAIGNGSINAANTPISNKNVDINQVREARRRTRNGGGTVPTKCLHLSKSTPF